MAERQETSVMVSIQEILRDAQNREEQEKVEAERRAREEEQRRLDEVRRQQEAQEARLRAEEEERQRRAFEEQKRQAEIAALQEAAVQRARMEAESQARLAEIASRQDHERQLKALGQDEHKKRLTLIASGLGVLFFVAAIGGGILIKNAMNEADSAKQQITALQSQIDDANAKQARLSAELANTKDPEKIAQLQAQLAEQQSKVQALNSQMGQARPRAASGGGAPAAKPTGGGGGGPSKPCNCTPGDPLCSCL
jgi:colicin import membrane protein